MIWSTWGICEGLPWAKPFLGTATGTFVTPGTVLDLALASRWGTTAEVTLTQGGQVIGGVQSDVFTLPPAGPPPTASPRFTG